MDGDSSKRKRGSPPAGKKKTAFTIEKKRRMARVPSLESRTKEITEVEKVLLIFQGVLYTLDTTPRLRRKGVRGNYAKAGGEQ